MGLYNPVQPLHAQIVFPKTNKKGLMNCISCEVETMELVNELHCQNCYDDGIYNRELYLALYYQDQERKVDEHN